MGEARTLGVLLVVGSSRRRRRWGLLCSVGKGRGGKNPPGARGRGGREVKAAAAADDAETQRLLRRLSRACPAPRPHADLRQRQRRATPFQRRVRCIRGAGVPELRRRRMRRGTYARVRVRRASGSREPGGGAGAGARGDGRMGVAGRVALRRAVVERFRGRRWMDWEWLDDARAAGDTRKKSSDLSGLPAGCNTGNILVLFVKENIESVRESCR
jgi:hypothetical protein